ncbi:MAG TPA: tetratricopeptide repeat protein [Thermoanaerobaculia bacterium]|jgi:putative thioredoxin
MAHTENIIDVTTADFEDAVLRRSAQVPVLVDFWAPWCGPCRVLGPVLEKIAAESDGAFVLARVNSDESPELAERYGVRGIPNAQLFKDGGVVDQFVGAVPEAGVRAFLRPHCATEANRLLAEGERQAAAGDLEAAGEAFERALGEDRALAGAHLGLARIALARGDHDALQRHVDAIPPDEHAYDAAQALTQAAALAREAAAVGDPAACEKRLAGGGVDVEAHYALGGHAVAAGRYRDALEHYLAAARADRHWRDEAARRAMVAVFGLVGARDPLAEEFRDKLRSLYY